MVQKTSSHVARRAFVGLVTLLVLVVVPAALAERGGNGHGHHDGYGTLTVVMVADENGDSLPNWGDTITFDVSTTATDEPHVDVTCYQDGTLVYSAWTGYYDSYPWPWTQNMTLSSQAWTGGAADCTATLSAYSGSSVETLSTLDFLVGA
jgi:hypothetical protein